jgi:hypothetical protein
MQTAEAFPGMLRDETRLKLPAGHSLHCGLDAPPPASQASVPGVACATQTRSISRVVPSGTSQVATNTISRPWAHGPDPDRGPGLHRARGLDLVYGPNDDCLPTGEGR